MDVQDMKKSKEAKEVDADAGRTITLVLRDIPEAVNERLADFQLMISAERHEKMTLKESYVEFLKEATGVSEPSKAYVNMLNLQSK